MTSERIRMPFASQGWFFAQSKHLYSHRIRTGFPQAIHRTKSWRGSCNAPSRLDVEKSVGDRQYSFSIRGFRCGNYIGMLSGLP